MNSNDQARTGIPIYCGLGLIAMATLCYQILMTRIFSVTLWYHFAFIAVSVAMFGMSLGAVMVHLLSRHFRSERLGDRLANYSLAFALTIVASFFAHLLMKFDPLSGSRKDLGLQAITYLIFAVPFTCSGVAVALALTRYPKEVSQLYASDLVGAAVGCVLLPLALVVTRDAPSCVFLCATAAALAATLFSRRAHSMLLRSLCIAAFILLSLSSAVIQWRAAIGQPLVKLAWVKGKEEGPLLFERWSVHSRVEIHGDLEKPSPIVMWSLSPAYTGPKEHPQLIMTIDACAGSALTKFDGDLSKVDYLKWDITNVVHRLRPTGALAIIGAGGGRDVLGGLLYGHDPIYAIELDSNLLLAVNETFGDFTGHLDRNPHVKFIHGEGRSFISSLDERFQVIQASLIDTFSATSAGAFTLSENSIYTSEAWAGFLQRLEPGGVLNFTRYYATLEMPGEIYRLMSLAREALLHEGVRDPGKHVVLIRNLWKRNGPSPYGMGTILVSNQPFSDADLDTLEQAGADFKFEIAYSPRDSLDPNFAKLISPTEAGPFIAAAPIDATAPTDNRPYFFQMARMKRLFDPAVQELYTQDLHLGAVKTLLGLLCVVIFMAAVFIILPMLIAPGEIRPGVRDLWYIGYFGAIGIGFMFIEITQLQRLTVYLGHPTYSLTVSLFSVLLFSGLGSLSTARVDLAANSRKGVLRLATLVLTLAAYGLLTMPLLSATRGWTTPSRIVLAAALLAPLSFLMGMAFPIGMKLGQSARPKITAWLWSINGAASVVASVLAAVVSILTSISTSYWCGVAAYLLALVSIWKLSGRKTSNETAN